jgi:XTP/dITP diphosphohydrolase
VGSAPTILIATTNQGKLREAREILAGLPVRLATLEDYPGLPEAIEDAATFEGNAERKALHYARLTGCWTLAEDSGLSVDALNGGPGVYSARYAGPEADPVANNAQLVVELAGIPPEKRGARFCCAVVLADTSGVLGRAFGVVDGVIVDEPRGRHGFGYDPHFYVPEYGMTTAEMSPEQKNRISHRGKAFRAIRPQIERLVAGSASP